MLAHGGIAWPDDPGAAGQASVRARDLADRDYAEPIGVDELAAAARLSRAHFSREFSRTFGESPKAYLMTRRLERAARAPAQH